MSIDRNGRDNAGESRRYGWPFQLLFFVIGGPLLGFFLLFLYVLLLVWTADYCNNVRDHFGPDWAVADTTALCRSGIPYIGPLWLLLLYVVGFLPSVFSALFTIYFSRRGFGDSFISPILGGAVGSILSFLAFYFIFWSIREDFWDYYSYIIPLSVVTSVILWNLIRFVRHNTPYRPI